MKPGTLKLLLTWTLMVGALLGVNLLFFPDDIGFFGISPHPFFIVVIAFALRHNWQESTTTTLLTVGLHQFLFWRSPLCLDTEQLFEGENIFQVATFLALGFVLSHKIQGLEEVSAFLRREVRRFREKADLQLRTLDAQKELTRYLESRLAGSTHTFGNIHRISGFFQSHEPEQMLRGFFEVLSLLKVEESGWYPVEGGGVARLAMSSSEQHSLPATVRLDRGVVARALAEREIVWQETDDEKDPVFCAVPFQRDDKLVGLFCITRISFLAFNRETVSILRIMLQWLAQTWDHADRWNEREAQVLFRSDADVYSYSYLNTLLDRAIADSRRYKTGFSLVRLEFLASPGWRAQESRTVSQVLIRQLLRTGDLLCEGDREEERILFLPHTNMEGAEICAEKVVEALSSFFGGEEAPALQCRVICYEPDDESAAALLERMRRPAPGGEQ